MSSKAVVELAKNLGYQQVEFHPTWAIWWETLTRDKLSCQAKDISSFHMGWREDARIDGYSFLERNLLIPAYRIFPYEPLGIKTLRKLEKKYQKPIVIYWQKDFARFKSPILELHRPLGMNFQQIEKAIKRGKIKGVVLDTDKFGGWLKQTGDKEDQALSKFFPYIKEIHFRFRHKKDIEPLSGGRETKSARVMKKLVKMGYKGRVVVEMGWPDPGSIAVLRQKGLKTIHQRIVKFLKSL